MNLQAASRFQFRKKKLICLSFQGMSSCNSVNCLMVSAERDRSLGYGSLWFGKSRVKWVTLGKMGHPLFFSFLLKNMRKMLRIRIINEGLVYLACNENKKFAKTNTQAE